MWDFICSLFKRFERRDIFRYWNGRRYKRIDPWSAYRSSLDFPGFSWDSTPKLIALEATDSDSLKVRLEAVSDAVKMVRSVFAVKPVEEGGLTEFECLELMNEFSRYVYGVKKNSRPTPILLPSTEPPHEATKPDSDSGSTGIEPEPEKPTGSPKESDGPSATESS